MILKETVTMPSAIPLQASLFQVLLPAGRPSLGRYYPVSRWLRDHQHQGLPEAPPTVLYRLELRKPVSSSSTPLPRHGEVGYVAAWRGLPVTSRLEPDISGKDSVHGTRIQ